MLKLAEKNCMSKVLAKIGRQNHSNHLVAVMPLITLVYGVQCFIMYKYASTISIGDYALSLGVMLSAFIGMMVYYDNNHNVLIYPDHLHIHFPALGTDEKIMLSEITEIIAPQEECPFSNLIVKTQDKKYVFYFVDFPVHVKALIESQMREEQEEDFQQAA